MDIFMQFTYPIKYVSRGVKQSSQILWTLSFIYVVKICWFTEFSGFGACGLETWLWKIEQSCIIFAWFSGTKKCSVQTMLQPTYSFCSFFLLTTKLADEIHNCSGSSYFKEAAKLKLHILSNLNHCMVGVPYPDIAPSRLLGNLGRNLPVQSLQCSYCSRGRSKILWISPAVTWSLESGSTCRFRAMSVNEGLICVLNNKLLSCGLSSHAPVGCTPLQQVLRSSFSQTIITTSPTPWTTPISHNPCTLFIHPHLTFLHLPFSPQYIIGAGALVVWAQAAWSPSLAAGWIKRLSIVEYGLINFSGMNVQSSASNSLKALQLGERARLRRLCGSDVRIWRCWLTLIQNHAWSPHSLTDHEISQGSVSKSWSQKKT